MSRLLKPVDNQCRFKNVATGGVSTHVRIDASPGANETVIDNNCAFNELEIERWLNEGGALCPESISWRDGPCYIF